MMFVDASAIVAILTGEPDADTLIDAIDRTSGAITSPIAIFEATAGLCRKRQIRVEDAYQHIIAFTTAAQIAIASITTADTEAAITAFARYGKGRGHPAQLNLGDCFAYALARTHDMPILFKGDGSGGMTYVPSNPVPVIGKVTGEPALFATDIVSL
jgi:ribonuclease VapC